MCFDLIIYTVTQSVLYQAMFIIAIIGSYMAWGDNNQGPWGSGGNSSKGNGGMKPPSGGGGSGGNEPPDLDEMLRKGKEQFNDVFGGGAKMPIIILLVAVMVALLYDVPYEVDAGEEGIVLRFGKHHRSTESGLHFKFPAPIEKVVKVPVDTINTLYIGYRPGQSEKSSRSILEEGLMLTKNRNIADVNFSVNWKIVNAEDFLFNVRDPLETVIVVSESAMREVVSSTTFSSIVAGGKDKVAKQVKELIQKRLDSYKSGIYVTQLNIRPTNPPPEAIDAFKDVGSARQERDRAIEQAEAYRNDIIPRARGESEKIIQEAEAYKQAVINKAEGEGARFISVYNQYKNAKDVTIKRIYIETMEEVLSGTEKILLDSGASGSGVIPYLPLPELKRNKGN